MRRAVQSNVTIKVSAPRIPSRGRFRGSNREKLRARLLSFRAACLRAAPIATKLDRRETESVDQKKRQNHNQRDCSTWYISATHGNKWHPLQPRSSDMRADLSVGPRHATGSYPLGHGLVRTIPVVATASTRPALSAALELVTSIAHVNLKHKKKHAAEQRKCSKRGNRPRVLVQADHDQHNTEQQKKDGRRFLDQETFPYVACHIDSSRLISNGFTVAEVGGLVWPRVMSRCRAPQRRQLILGGLGFSAGLAACMV